MISVVITLIGSGQSSWADDWPQWLGPNRDGISHETNWQAVWPEEGPKKLWQKKVGIGYATVSVRGGRVYTMGNDGRNDIVWCLDADTGNTIWKHSYPCRGGGGGWPGARIAPTIDGSYLYTLSLKGHIYCLNADTGEVIWSKDSAKELGARGSRHGFSCHPIIDGNKVIYELGAKRGNVVAFDKTSGKVLWQAGRHRTGHSSPVIYESGRTRYLVVWTASALVGMSLEDGRELWRFPCSIEWDAPIATPIISGAKIFISSLYYDRGSVLLSLIDGKPKVVWQGHQMQNHCSNSVLWKGYLYGFDGRVATGRGRGLLKCVEFKTGRLKWTQGGFGTGALMLADGKLIILGDRGELAIAEATPEKFKLISRAKVLEGICWNMPVLANGRIYCRSFEGDLVCLDVRKKWASAPLPLTPSQRYFSDASSQRSSGLLRSQASPENQSALLTRRTAGHRAGLSRRSSWQAWRSRSQFFPASSTSPPNRGPAPT